jgi:hypothetical protein
MNQRTFTNKVGNGRTDLLQDFLEILHEAEIEYCVIGGLAVNAYADPVVSLDLDVAIIAAKIAPLLDRLKAHYAIREYPHSINVNSKKSDFRIQIQTDPRYQEFLGRSKEAVLLGYKVRVAAIEDVIQGKIWAYQDDSRRSSKRLKDLSDIARLVEARPDLATKIPNDVRSKINL